jgi:hypothetical protein
MRRSLAAACLAAGLSGLSSAAHAGIPSVVINEVRTGQPGPDFDEYIEIRGEPGTSLNGLAYIVIGDDDLAVPPSQNGSIEFVLGLDGLTIPASGLLVIAPSTFTLGVANVITPLGFEDNSNVTHMIVAGFFGGVGTDVDLDDDGTIDFTPWSEIVSSVALVRGDDPDGIADNFVYSDHRVGPVGGNVPSHVFRCPNLDEYRAGATDPSEGTDTPGAENPACESEKIALRISEIRIDQPGTDIDEYFELQGEPGQSLAGLFYIVIGDGPGGSGVVETVVDLNDLAIPASGFFVAAETSFTLGNATVILPGTNPLNFENGDNVTHMLVRDFTGTLNQDLDTNDDGVLDITPWTEVVDSIALILGPGGVGGNDWFYSENVVGPDGSFVPGHAYRCDPAGDWRVGVFAIGSTDTPGAVNLPCPSCGGNASCFEPHAGRGCNLVDCCTLVCAVDPTCCDAAWDAACVAIAQSQCLGGGTAPTLQINEIRIGQAGPDTDEYFEIVGAPGTPLTGVSYVVLGAGADPFGVVESVTLLEGTMPETGILLVARSTFALGIPNLVRNSINFVEGDTRTHLLVYDFVGKRGDDLDLDNDCTLDTTPWSAIIDGVTLLGFDPLCGYVPTTVGPDSVFSPAHAYRCVPDGLWIAGLFGTTEFDTPGAANPACPGESPCGGPKSGSCFEANGTPGCEDADCCEAVCAIDPACCDAAWDKLCAQSALSLCFVPPEPPSVRLSEIRIDEPGTDINEYFEIVGEPGTSLNGLTYIVIGDGAAAQGSGVIEMVLPLNGVSIPASGFFLAARPTFALPATPDLVTTDIVFENSDNVTHLIVWEFTGALGQDLDTNDDGVLDIEPWSSVVDGVALIESAEIPPVGTEWTYWPVTVGPDGPFVPSHVKFCPTTEVWTLGTFDLSTSDDSPGAPNPDCDYDAEPEPCIGDLDGDGIVGPADLAILLGGWGGAGSSDLNGSGTTDAADLALLLGAWGGCP